MVTIPEWLYQAALAFGGVMGGALASGGVMAIKLANRTSVLETRMAAAEAAQRAMLAETTAGLKEIQAEVKATRVAIATAREEALRFFAPHGDLQRLEDKFDAMRADVLRAARPRSPRTKASAPARK